MPKMSFGSRLRKFGQWWTDRSLLERTLILVTSFAVLLLIILLVQQKHSIGSSIKPCTTPICLKQASKILLYGNFNTNPCEDFYQFVCGNFKINAEGDDKLTLKKFETEKLLEMYQEPVRDSEHKMIKAVKKYFQACMNISAIESDGVKTIKEALKVVGGWPAVEGSNWNEADFDWVESTYKLRQLGYEYSIFLDLSILYDPDDQDKHIYKVSTASTDDYQYKFLDLDKVGLMTDVAMIFGATDRENVLQEMTKSHTFMEELQKNDHPPYIRNSFQKITVNEYQQKCGFLDWLQFINNIAGPTAQISKDEFVLFPPPRNISGWLDLISKTPKRTQANYLMWKVVQEILPFLMSKLEARKGLKLVEDREKFCMWHIDKSFNPNPLTVMLNRKYISVKRRKQLEKLLLNIKSELVEVVKRSDWIEQTEKLKTAERIKNLTILIAQPENYYFGDKILDDSGADMMELQSDTFLARVAQGNRNRLTTRYNYIRDLFSKGDLVKSHYLFIHGGNIPLYFPIGNSLYVPNAATQGSFFHEQRPNYLNYGAIGALVGYHLTGVVINLSENYLEGKVWSNKTKEAFKKKTRCLEKEVLEYGLQPMIVSHVTVAEQVSYAAYGSWVKRNEIEEKLVEVSYTPNQLFWISAVSTFCYTNLHYDYPESLFKNLSFISDIVSISLRNNKNFANDFNCPRGAKLNPTNRCSIF